MMSSILAFSSRSAAVSGPKGAVASGMDDGRRGEGGDIGSCCGAAVRGCDRHFWSKIVKCK
ncbi:hypothetical protein [Tychonema sp. LEGE 07203]|uniref:hypothetical protein n=1 Tax=Tychonema sp. LEGE 07203 TaxID=1828671 RepID=UPI0018808D0C|nr:hypothetical protein [Tychonema sp. LEGE 07203]MBE9095670.1 hypothetical protein [Tychonema sp. LEGE 07203]